MCINIISISLYRLALSAFKNDGVKADETEIGLEDVYQYRTD